MSELPKRYWFRAKPYGWGWGLPLTWEGWVVLGAYTVAIISVAALFPPPTHTASFLTGEGVATALLVLICARTGETPHWRWGKLLRWRK